MATGKARFAAFAEGLCVKIMHTGPYSTEPEKIRKMDVLVEREGLRKRSAPGRLWAGLAAPVFRLLAGGPEGGGRKGRS